MKNKQLLSLVLSTILVSTIICTTAFADTTTSSESNAPTIPAIIQVDGVTVTSGKLLNKLDESWLDNYTVISKSNVVSGRVYEDIFIPFI